MTSTAFRKEEGRVLNRASEILFFFLLILCLFTAVRPCAFFLIISLSSNFGVVFVSGAAGCVATLLHDAVMNPAEGKGNILLYTTVCLWPQFGNRIRMCVKIFFSVKKFTGATPGPTVCTWWP